MQNAIITSPYILNKIKTTSWANKEYIIHLITIDGFVKNGATGVAGNQVYFILRNKYPLEYLELLNEFNPKKAAQEKISMQKENKQNLKLEKKIKIKEQIKEQKDFERWILLGGKP